MIEKKYIGPLLFWGCIILGSIIYNYFYIKNPFKWKFIDKHKYEQMEFQFRVAKDKEFWEEQKNKKYPLIEEMMKNFDDENKIRQVCRADKVHPNCCNLEIDTEQRILKVNFLINGIGDNYCAIVYDSTDNFYNASKKTFGGDITFRYRLEENWYLVFFT